MNEGIFLSIPRTAYLHGLAVDRCGPQWGFAPTRRWCGSCARGGRRWRQRRFSSGGRGCWCSFGLQSKISLRKFIMFVFGLILVQNESKQGRQLKPRMDDWFGCRISWVLQIGKLRRCRHSTFLLAKLPWFLIVTIDGSAESLIEPNWSDITLYE